VTARYGVVLTDSMPLSEGFVVLSDGKLVLIEGLILEDGTTLIDGFMLTDGTLLDEG